MTFRKEIFQFLRKRHKNVPKAILDRVADHLEKKVSQKDEIETSVDDTDGLVTAFSNLLQSETDRRVEEALKKRSISSNSPAGGGEDTESGKKKQVYNNMPDWAKSMDNSCKTLSDRITVLEQKLAPSCQTKLTSGVRSIEDVIKKHYAPTLTKQAFNTGSEAGAPAFSQQPGDLIPQKMRVKIKVSFILE